MENVVREGLPEKVSSEQRPEWTEQATCLSRERAFQVEGQVGAMALRSALRGTLKDHRPGQGRARQQLGRPAPLHSPPSAQTSLSGRPQTSLTGHNL